MLFGTVGGPARCTGALVVKKLTNKVLIRASKAIAAVKASHAEQLASARINRELALGYLLSDLVFEKGVALPERAEAEKAGKRAGTHLGGVVKRLERLAYAVAEQARTAKAKQSMPAAQLAEALAGIETAAERDRKALEGEPYVLFKERAAMWSDNDAGNEDAPLLRSEEAARSARLKEADVAHDTLEVAIERVFAFLRSNDEVELRERRLDTGLRIALRRDPTMQPIWREVCEERLLAHHLIERQMVEQLRDRDEDVDYWHQQCQEKGAALRMAAQNLRRLEAQVVFLGGSLPDTAFTASEDAEHHGEPVPPDARGVNAVIRELLGRSMSELR